MDNIITKKCRKCGEYKDMTMYKSNGINKKTGLRQYKAICSVCRVNMNREQYMKRKERGYYKKPEETDKVGLQHMIDMNEEPTEI